MLNTACQDRRDTTVRLGLGIAPSCIPPVCQLRLQACITKPAQLFKRGLFIQQVLLEEYSLLSASNLELQALSGEAASPPSSLQAKRTGGQESCLFPPQTPAHFISPQLQRELQSPVTLKQLGASWSRNATCCTSPRKTDWSQHRTGNPLRTPKHGSWPRLLLPAHPRSPQHPPCSPRTTQGV